MVAQGGTPPPGGVDRVVGHASSAGSRLVVTILCRLCRAPCQGGGGKKPGPVDGQAAGGRTRLAYAWPQSPTLGWSRLLPGTRAGCCPFTLQYTTSSGPRQGRPHLSQSGRNFDMFREHVDVVDKSDS